MRWAIFAAVALALACGTRTEYFCNPGNCDGCCHGDVCLEGTGPGLCGSGGLACGTCTTDAGEVSDSGTPMPGPDAGADDEVVVAMLAYEIPAKPPIGCGGFTRDICKVTKTLSHERLLELVGDDYADCTVSVDEDIYTISCIGNCWDQTYSCSTCGTCKVAYCDDVPWTHSWECYWAPPI